MSRFRGRILMLETTRKVKEYSLYRTAPIRKKNTDAARVRRIAVKGIIRDAYVACFH